MRALGRAGAAACRQALGPVAGLLALWAIGWQATGDALATVRAGLNLAPFVLALAGAVTLAALAMGRRMTALVAASVAGLLAAAAPASLTRIRLPAAAAPGLTLVTLSNRTANTDMAATAAALRAHAADIVILQEVAGPAALVAALTGLYRPGAPPGHCAAAGYLILSRFAVGPATLLDGSIALRCRVALPGGDADVYSVHLPRATGDTAHQTRALATLLGDAAGRPGAVIVAGDFNATPLTATMRRAGGVLANAFDRAGRGPGFTFPTPARRLGRLGPFLRIDHVLLGRDFRPLTARSARWHPPGADHFPVEVGFSDLRGLRG